MSIRWYVLRSKPNQEEVLWREVHARGYEVFYPQIRVQPVNPRSRKVRPYFPGYMFVNIDLSAVGFSAFRWMPHSYGLVAFGGEPAYVPENLVSAIRKHVDEINARGGELPEGIKTGETVTVRDGIFTGYEAIFDTHLSGIARVRVLLKVLHNRQVPLELSLRQVELK